MNFETWLDQQQLSPNTISAYIGDVDLFATWLQQRDGRALHPGLITLPNVRQWLNGLETDHAFTTLNRKIASLKKYVAFGLAQDTLQFDPLESLSDYDVEDDFAPRHLTEAEEDRVLSFLQLYLNAARTPFARLAAVRDLAVYMLMRYSGLRVSEVCNLTLNRMQIGVRKGVFKIIGKGNKEATVFTTNPEELRWLNRWLEIRQAIPNGSEWLFVGKRGDRLDVSTVQRRFKEIGRLANVELTPHRLRHTCVRRLLDDGAQPQVVQKIARHKRIETTLAVYARPSKDDCAQAVAHVP